MLLNSEESTGKLRRYFAEITAYVTISSSLSLYDINKFLEDFFCDLLNIIYGYKLVNLNLEETNFPSIDLGDTASKICYQITSSSNSGKISETINKFEKHNLFNEYDSLKILVLDMSKHRYTKKFITNGKYSFNVATDLISLNDLIFVINSLSKEKIDDVLKSIQSNLKPINEVSEETIDMILFRSLFESIVEGINNLNSQDVKNNVIYDLDLDKKKKRFEFFWKYIEENYSKVINTGRERVYTETQSTFEEANLVKVQEFLNLESRKQLVYSKDDPLKAIDLLCEEIIKKFKLGFVSESEIKYFLYYQLYNCTVFPNI
ncbi:MAG: SMEK domain-containing protein [Microgenomates group bacterium]